MYANIQNIAIDLQHVTNKVYRVYMVYIKKYTHMLYTTQSISIALKK